MLERAGAALAARDVDAEPALATLEDFAPQRPFDCLLAAHVIEHVADPVASLARMREFAGKEARLWLIVSKPHWCNAIIWFHWRHRAYRPESVKSMLEKAGWQLEMEYAFPSGPPSRTSRGYLAKRV